MEQTYEEFYEMMHEWIVTDFCTQGIKAEVIIDTLISEFVAEMIAAMEDGNRYRYRLLMKEFPVKINTLNNLRNDKADYLVGRYEGDWNKITELYLVELKTTASSIEESQFRHYCKCKKDGAKVAMDFFKKILEKNVKNLRSAKRISKKAKPEITRGENAKEELSDGKKYVTSVLMFSGEDEIEEQKFLDFRKSLDEKTGVYDATGLEIVYIVLTNDQLKKACEMFEDKGIDKKVISIESIIHDSVVQEDVSGINYGKYRENFIHLLEKSGKTAKWKCVERILRSLIEPAGSSGKPE